jgi:hypothetical protein
MSCWRLMLALAFLVSPAQAQSRQDWLDHAARNLDVANHAFSAAAQQREAADQARRQGDTQRAIDLTRSADSDRAYGREAIQQATRAFGAADAARIPLAPIPRSGR